MVTTKRTKIPNLSEQFLVLGRAFPESTGRVLRNQLRWKAMLQPSALSDSYMVRLEYSLEKSPRVFVDSPVLLERDEERIPHRYADGSLCLYLPGTQEWEKTLYLADTIIPWTAEWLIHYELWHATGVWHGGGVHPERRSKEKQS